MNIALVESVETTRKLIIVVLMEGLNADRLPIHVLRLLRDEILLEYPESENGIDLETLWKELALEIRKSARGRSLASGFHYGYFVWTLLIVVVNARNEVVEEHAGPSTDCSKSTRNAFNPAAALNGSKCSIEKTGCGKQLACDGKMFDSIPLEYPDISNPICSLNLNANIIQFICPEGFYGLTNLQFLNLSANKLTWPDSFMNGIFAPMVRLESLNLQGSKFSTFKGFGKEMKMLNNLRSLSMSPSSKGGDLFFEKEFLELKNLVNISFYDMLGECNIYNIRDNAFENVPYVKVLNLDNCHIRTISRHALKPLNSSLQVLSISQNKNLQFSGMNDALAGLENSSALITLRANAIHKFNGLGIAVKEDDIQYIQTFKAIEHLHLDLNKIEVLEKQILYPTYMLPGSLRAVTLAGNRLVGGGYILYLYKATNITFVDISGQYLNLRPFLHFGTQAGVQTSSLFDGIKSFIGDTTLTVTKHNVTLNMSYMSLECSCEQLPFWKWLSTTKVHKVVEANRCMLNGKPQRVEYPTDFLKVVNTLEHVECIDRRWITWAISGSSALVAVLLTLIISTIVYRNRWKLRYVYYSRKRRYVHTGFDRLFSNDAMISYSKGKASFIKSSVVPSLEHNHDLSLWIHDRDSAAGESVAENITHAICTSRKTVLFIDNEYLTDSWCGYDMNIALVESVETQRKLIIVLLMDGLNADRLPIHILRLLRDEILLEYPESENGNALETLWNELAIEIRK
ncbi:TLR4-like protein [Mya arenaria]|uniref:TLR4-like protein n=1 Tax=Mya arenaria TaxID=6604 RepID=A0ABY7DH80_MYAAR|nr:TLR4-like protein [Mya arenaria]